MVSCKLLTDNVKPSLRVEFIWMLEVLCAAVGCPLDDGGVSYFPFKTVSGVEGAYISILGYL